LVFGYIAEGTVGLEVLDGKKSRVERHSDFVKD
jgi:hypothetical protein